MSEIRAKIGLLMISWALVTLFGLQFYITAVLGGIGLIFLAQHMEHLDKGSPHD